MIILTVGFIIGLILVFIGLSDIIAKPIYPYIFGTCLVVYSIMIAINFNWKSHYDYNKKIINKHYEHDNIIYKVIIDTTETNKYIKKNFILKGK